MSLPLFHPHSLSHPHPVLPPANGSRHGRLVLAGLALLFALPLLLAAALHGLGWRPGGNSHGMLFDPPPLLPVSGLTALDGSPLPTAELAGRWQLLLAGAGPCDDACLGDLAAMGQIRRLLPKYQERLGQLWLTAADAGIPAQSPIHLAGLRSAVPDQAWQQALGLETAAGYRFCIVDPGGRLVLCYPPGADPAGVHQDLERLLKYSWAG